MSKFDYFETLQKARECGTSLDDYLLNEHQLPSGKTTAQIVKEIKRLRGEVEELLDDMYLSRQEFNDLSSDGDEAADDISSEIYNARDGIIIAFGCDDYVHGEWINSDY